MFIWDFVADTVLGQIVEMCIRDRGYIEVF